MEEIICVQAQTKICHSTLILLLHYLAKTIKGVRNYQAPWVLMYELSANSQKSITFSKKSCRLRCYKQQQHFNSAGLVCVQSVHLLLLGQKVTGVPLIMPRRVDARVSNETKLGLRSTGRDSRCKKPHITRHQPFRSNRKSLIGSRSADTADQILAENQPQTKHT